MTTNGAFLKHRQLRPIIVDHPSSSQNLAGGAPGNPSSGIKIAPPEYSSCKMEAGNFCALAYAPNPMMNELPAFKSIILVVVQEAEGALRFLVNPNLKDMVLDHDFAYISSLLHDFVERVETHAMDLFRQLCSLTVGILQTLAVGAHLSEHPDLEGLAVEFLAF